MNASDGGGRPDHAIRTATFHDAVRHADSVTAATAENSMRAMDVDIVESPVRENSLVGRCWFLPRLLSYPVPIRGRCGEFLTILAGVMSGDWRMKFAGSGDSWISLACRPAGSIGIDGHRPTGHLPGRRGNAGNVRGIRRRLERFSLIGAACLRWIARPYEEDVLRGPRELVPSRSPSSEGRSITPAGLRPANISRADPA